MLHQHKKPSYRQGRQDLKKNSCLVPFILRSLFFQYMVIYCRKIRQVKKSVWCNPLTAHISWRSVAFFFLHSKLGVEEGACSPETVYTSSTQLETQHSLVSAELPGCGSSRCLCPWYIHLKGFMLTWKTVHSVDCPCSSVPLGLQKHKFREKF